MSLVQFKVTSTAKAYWLAVDDADLPAGDSHIDLPEGDHCLVWYLTGDPGDTIEITIKVEGRPDEAVNDAIVDGQIHGAGYRIFSV